MIPSDKLADTSPEVIKRRRILVLSLLVGSMLLAATVVLALSVGPKDLGVGEVVRALFCSDSAETAQIVVRDIRLPRALLALIVGASLAAAGAIMQGVTGNPLAGPSIMGLNAGGTFCLLLGLLILPQLSYNQAILLSIVGAAGGYGIVCLVGSMARGGLTPVRLALAGTVVSAMLGSITHGLTIYYGMHDEMLYWTMGGIANVTWPQVVAVTPLCLVGMAGALWISPSVTVLSLGEEVAVGLGQRVTGTRMAATVCTLLLAGGATAVAGPVGFVGLMTPHVGRFFVGSDYARLIPLSAVLGACVTGLADVAARTLGGGWEIPLGLFTTIIGAPCFLWLIRRRGSFRPATAQGGRK
jgi:iron complex transport system permease protein